MNHLKISIILLLLILLLSFLSFLPFFNYYGLGTQEGYADMSAGSDSITVKQITILNSLLSDIDCKTATQVINAIIGMKLNNPHFDIILSDRNLSDYGKLVLLKETINHISSKSTVSENKSKNSINQAVISNSDEPIKDEITVENVVLIKNIVDGTDLENAEESIDAISKLDLTNSVIKPILEVTTLSSYNRILFIKYVIDRIVTDSTVKKSEMDKTWKQFVFNPSVTFSPTSPSPTPTATSLSITDLSSIVTTPPISVNNLPSTMTTPPMPDNNLPSTMTTPPMPDNNLYPTVTMPSIPDNNLPSTVTIPSMPNNNLPSTVTIP